MKIEEGNRLIAEFMGREFKPYKGNSSYDNPFPTYDQCMDFIVKAELHGYKPELGWKVGMGKYHTSWSWLMPVVEKIESLYEDSLIVYIKDKRAYIEADTQAGLVKEIPEIPQCYSGFCDTKIEAVYSTVTQFIQWYNQSNLITAQEVNERL